MGLVEPPWSPVVRLLLQLGDLSCKMLVGGAELVELCLGRIIASLGFLEGRLDLRKLELKVEHLLEQRVVVARARHGCGGWVDVGR